MAMDIAALIRSAGSSVLRLTAALTLTVVALGGLGLAGQWIYEFQDRRIAKEAETARSWSKDLTDLLGVKVQTRTKVTDGTLRIAVRVEGYPELFTYPDNQDRGFIFEWKDEDSFTRLEKSVNISDLNRALNAKGEPAGLKGEFSVPVNVKEYATIQKFGVRWNLEKAQQNVAAVATAPARREKVADHCAPDLSKRERLRRLAQHGTVRDSGHGEYTAGAHSVNLYPSDGTLLACS